MSAPMLGATRHVSLPVWVVDCACAGMQAERSIAATRAVPLAGRSIVLSVCLEFDYSFFLGFSDRVVKFRSAALLSPTSLEGLLRFSLHVCLRSQTAIRLIRGQQLVALIVMQ